MAYFTLGFTSTTLGNEERPQSVGCLQILASEHIIYLETTHTEPKEKVVDLFKKTALLFSNHSEVVVPVLSRDMQKMNMPVGGCGGLEILLSTKVGPQNKSLAKTVLEDV